MRMSAYEYVGAVGVYHRPDIQGIVPRIAAYVGHQHFQVFAVEELGEGAFETDFLGVAVAIYPNERLECRDGVHEVNA